MVIGRKVGLKDRKILLYSKSREDFFDLCNNFCLSTTWDGELLATGAAFHDGACATENDLCTITFRARYF
jgi:hypothetical protein